MYVPYAETENNLYTTQTSTYPHHLAESKYPYLYWTERHLQVMWWEQKYFKNLKTNESLSIEIISPGIWNAEAGPDFLKAHIKIGGQEFKGDIEIHLEDESWIQHKHHQDPRYDQVILHISLWLPRTKKAVVTSKGKKIHQTYLEHNLTISQTRILQLINLDQYPYRKFLGSGQCAQALFNSLPDEKIFDLFRSAAEWRLTQKAHYLKGHIDDQRLLLPAGIVMALGYKRNSESFFELFLRLLKHKDKTESELLSLALGMCGFFGTKYKAKWKDSVLYNDLLMIYEDLSYLIPHSISLSFNQIRPLNHPIRRMVYLVKLLKDPLMTSLYSEIYLCWHQNWPSSFLKKEWVQLRQMITDRLPSYTNEYWNRHYTFENEPQKQFLPLFGKDLKELVIINTVLPLLYVDILQKNNQSEIDAFRDFHRSLPAIYNSKAKYLSHRLFGDLPKKQILQKALAQQGAFQLYRDFCTHFEASCDGCSFVEKYKKTMKEKKTCRKNSDTAGG